MRGDAWSRGWLLSLAVLCGAAVAQSQPASTEWHASTPAQKALDAAAFQQVDGILAREALDVQSVVVVQRGRVLYEFYRDGSPDTLREVQSVRKSALSAVVGIAIGQGRIASIDQPVLALMPEWAGLNTDPRAAAITVRHLLTMTAGYGVDDPVGIKGGTMAPALAWARPMRDTPGQVFAYDNPLIPMLTAVLEKATGMPIQDYVREQLVSPLQLAEPDYRGGVKLRTLDLAKLGHLFLQKGAWGGKQIVPEWYALAATSQQNAGGSPGGLAYGYMWWVVPGAAPRPTFLASGYSGQIIWVHPESGLVIAGTSTISPAVQSRGQMLRLVRGGLFAAAQQRAKAENP